MKKIKLKIIAVFTVLLFTSIAASAKERDMADQIRSHGGLYTSVTTYTDLGPIMVITITYYCNDGTSLVVRDWWVD